MLIGCAQAQKPLVLKAFGVQDLSYATFVSVSRFTSNLVLVFLCMIFNFEDLTDRSDHAVVIGLMIATA